MFKRFFMACVVTLPMFASGMDKMVEDLAVIKVTAKTLQLQTEYDLAYKENFAKVEKSHLVTLTKMENSYNSQLTEFKRLMADQQASHLNEIKRYSQELSIMGNKFKSLEIKLENQDQLFIAHKAESRAKEALLISQHEEIIGLNKFLYEKDLKIESDQNKLILLNDEKELILQQYNAVSKSNADNLQKAENLSATLSALQKSHSKALLDLEQEKLNNAKTTQEKQKSDEAFKKLYSSTISQLMTDLDSEKQSKIKIAKECASLNKEYEELANITQNKSMVIIDYEKELDQYKSVDMPALIHDIQRLKQVVAVHEEEARANGNALHVEVAKQQLVTELLEVLAQDEDSRSKIVVELLQTITVLNELTNLEDVKKIDIDVFSQQIKNAFKGSPLETPKKSGTRKISDDFMIVAGPSDEITPKDSAK